MALTANVKSPSDLMSNLQAIHGQVASAERTFLFLDFDGTLAPIVSVPSLATVPADVQSVLRTISLHSEISTSVISGRALDDLKARVGLPLICAGDHGMEIQGPDFDFAIPDGERIRYRLLALCNQLRTRLSWIEGALIECKRFSASVHVRQVHRGDVAETRGIVESIVGEYLDFQIRGGKEVFEIRPIVPWNKGTAARWILEKLGGKESNVICIGDDITDEDMFAEFPSAINIRIGLEGKTAAQYWIAESDVVRVLCSVLDASRLKAEKSFVAPQPVAVLQLT